MKVYITCWQDHHDDPIIKVYRGRPQAINDTRLWVKERCRNSNYSPVVNDCDDSEWEDYVYHVEITSYGDWAWVKETELQ